MRRINPIESIEPVEPSEPIPLSVKFYSVGKFFQKQ